MNKAQELASHIAYCGLDCCGCEVYQATAFDDDGLRQNYADKVRHQWKIEVDPASINCHGCRDTRPKSGFCASCEVRQCAAERGLENCASCDGYGCEKLQKVHTAMIHVGKAIDGLATASINLDRIRNNMGLT